MSAWFPAHRPRPTITPIWTPYHQRLRRGPELDGIVLMQTAFSPKNPIIVLADQTTQSGRDMQRGYMDLFAGVMAAIRNPKAHGNVAITPERALHLLFVASTLWYTLDERP